MTDTPLIHPAIVAARQHSRYLTNLFVRHPQLIEITTLHLDQPFSRQAMLDQLPAPQTEEQLSQQLRSLRQAVMARLITREINHLSDLNEVVTTTSDLAEVALSHALQFVSQATERIGLPIGEDSGTVQELIIVGMGKLGGRELNVSSDIDLIFVYPEDGQTNGTKPISNHEYFAQIGKKLIRIIGDTTADGFVFRVDMRLRPFGDSGPLASSFAALENYLLTQGREWERYAWIKGRALSGDAAGLMSLVTPFIYRKYLDYGAYHSMRELHSQIRREVARKDRFENVKLGPGGIREIEFIGQVFQLIRGGRTKTLQQRPTQVILNELEQQGTLPADIVSQLQAAYVFLRNVEHRIMYLDDAQTQMLPTQSDDQARLALSMGFAQQGVGDWVQFKTTLDAHRARVTAQFELIFALPEQNTLNGSNTETHIDQYLDEDTSRLSALGFAKPLEIQRRLNALHDSSKYRQMPDRCRQRLDAILPSLITISAQVSNPDITLTRLLDLLEAIGRRESYLALLAEHPQALKRLAALYSASPWVSEYLTRHPILLDELLDSRLLHQVPDWGKLGEQLRQEIRQLKNDTEAKMDCLRHFQHTQIFRLVSQDLAELLPLETLSDHLSDLADLILSVAIEEVWREMPNTHRDTPLFAIIGYGKLGGKELGYASDLDLVFLYEDEHPNAGEIYARFAKRVVNWLTSMTSAGQLYDIDLRLRPNGTSGLLVSSIDAFEQYQRNSAWVWEHQALTRARYCAGDAAIGQQFTLIRNAVICLERDIDSLKAEVKKMREKILETHPASAVDVKHLRGGIVDIEFIMQFLILAYSATIPALTANLGNIALLDTAAQHGLISSHAAEHARIAYRALRRLQHINRLNGTPLTPDMIAPLENDLQSVQATWQNLFG
ncbi:bifunctional [glutamate--ammonia ligase]-adenylyl-L-tyrosine phosphorylase/[glutamate--ammonia-ligase] adenylyltransferase [uncultured Deefgea sp.]|uniref:bifunctional [glutamate--ammonia ligase]-adenylyl-L-tyrosine phosphorylase/[glutamate--ammonia-ligase] adenylyltransferase n=1 Tax=uncultured Deefgea sp. TaxID=1304914 RepID=UPI002622C55E|nr:bifunctional [glutamate--ammonia ligase]-adenylyl-L-tyrosine phosphorylase/[glutamate--ammonia-ligase] adenylyltransferase [uncultured Deefgea sp.]